MLNNEFLRVSCAELVLTDRQQSRSVPVRITYPHGPGQHPVIIFSHGLGGCRKGYSYLAEFWAHHGFVCVQPSHDDSVSYNRERMVPFSLLSALRKLPHDKELWRSRVNDIALVIDALRGDFREWPAKIDTDKIAVAGHSLGAFAGAIIAGARTPREDLGPSIDFPQDGRVKAILAISPHGVRTENNDFGFDTPNCYRIRMPAMFITGDRDATRGNNPTKRADAYRYSPPGGKYFLLLNGANHMTFAGEREAEQHRTADQRSTYENLQSMPHAYGDERHQLQIVQEATTLFFQAYIQNDHQVRSYLERGGLVQMLADNGSSQNK
jgi:predicted dienelactone hydrolase